MEKEDNEVVINLTNINKFITLLMVAVMAFGTTTTVLAEEGTEVQMGSETWKKEADGYYYYQRCVQPGERTELFMTAVRINDKGSPMEDFSLTIYTETVQSGNHTDITDAFTHLTV